MKTRLGIVAIVLIAAAVTPGCVTSYGYQQTVPMGNPGPPPVAYVDDGSDQPFHDDLAPYGDWVYVSGPGWVWSPASIQVDWRPYQMGHWVYTDYGWTWASDEPFGWAVYHYGRWHQDARYGWVWVPGTEWGPAWVAWHEGGGYVGWAPMPWQTNVRVGVAITSASLNVSIAPAWWSFVAYRSLVDINVRTRIVPATRNVTLVQTTRNVTNYIYVDNRIVNQSVNVQTIGRACGRPVQKYRVADAADAVEATRGRGVRGSELVVYRPNPSRGRTPQRRITPPGHDASMERLREYRHELPPPTGPDAPPQETRGNEGDTPHDDHGQHRGNRVFEGATVPPGRGPQPPAPQDDAPPPSAGPANTPSPVEPAHVGRPAPADQPAADTKPRRVEAPGQSDRGRHNAAKDAAAALKAKKDKGKPEAPKTNGSEDEDSKKNGGRSSNHGH